MGSLRHAIRSHSLPLSRLSGGTPGVGSSAALVTCRRYFCRACPSRGRPDGHHTTSYRCLRRCWECVWPIPSLSGTAPPPYDLFRPISIPNRVGRPTVQRGNSVPGYLVHARIGRIVDEEHPSGSGDGLRCLACLKKYFWESYGDLCHGIND